MTAIMHFARQTTSSASSSSTTGASASSSGTSTTGGSSSTTTSNTAIFPSPTSARPENPPAKSNPSQLVLEWTFALAALGLLLGLLLCRYRHLRRHGRPLRALFQRSPSPDEFGSRPFLNSSRTPRPSPDPNLILPSHPLHSTLHSDALFTVPTIPAMAQGHGGARRPRVPTNAPDIDAQGRRIGTVDPEEHGEGIEKELLPAYDGGLNGPPKYADVWSPVRVVGRQGNVVELAEVRREDSSSGHGHDRSREVSPQRRSGHDVGERSQSVSPPPRTQEPQHAVTSQAGEQSAPAFPMPSQPEPTYG